MSALSISKSLIAGAALLATGLFTAPTASASVISFDVTSSQTDTSISRLNDSSFTAGIQFFNSANDTTGIPQNRFFDFYEPGRLTIEYDGSATLTGRLVSREDPNFAFDVVYNLESSGVGPDGPVLRNFFNSALAENGGPISAADFEFFNIINGTFSGVGDFAGLNFDITQAHSPLQIGTGASGKNADLGIAAWFLLNINGDCTSAFCRQFEGVSVRGDIHADISPVPVPGAFLLFGTGLVGFGAARRKKKIAA